MIGSDEVRIFPGNYPFRAFTKTGDGQTQMLVPGNPNRVCLVVASAGLAAVRVSPRATLTASEGFGCPTAGGFLEFTWAKHGSAVTSDWYFNAGMGTIVEAFEVLVNPSGEV